MSMVFLIFLKHVGKFFVVFVSNTAPAHFNKGDCFFTRAEQVAQILTVFENVLKQPGIVPVHVIQCQVFSKFLIHVTEFLVNHNRRVCIRMSTGDKLCEIHNLARNTPDGVNLRIQHRKLVFQFFLLLFQFCLLFLDHFPERAVLFHKLALHFFQLFFLFLL